MKRLELFHLLERERSYALILGSEEGEEKNIGVVFKKFFLIIFPVNDKWLDSLIR